MNDVAFHFAFTPLVLAGLALACFALAGMCIWLLYLAMCGVGCGCPIHVLRSQKNDGTLVLRTEHSPDCSRA